MVDQINFPTPQAYSGGADFSQLANLGNVYRAAQDRARQQAALSSLGSDPTANTQALIQSGDPSLAALGLRLQQQATENTRSNAYLSIAQAQAQRAQEEADRIEEARKAAPLLYERLLGGGQSGTPQPRGPAPFPAPLPGQTPMPAGIMPPQGAPAMPPPIAPGGAQPPPGDLDARIAQSAQALPGSGAAYPGVTPLPNAPAAVSPPLMAADENAGLPAWAGPQSTVARMVDTLAAGRPAAAAGIDNKALAEALANPETRAIATVFAQNRLNPGTWKIEKADDGSGRIYAINDRDPTKSMDVTPPTPGGGPPMNKEDRERQNIYDDAIRSGYPEQAALFMKFNKGKPPSESMTPAEIKQFTDLNNTARTADVFVGNLKRMQELSKNAYEGLGAQAEANAATGLLGSKAPQAAIDTQEMVQIAKENAALQLRSTFGSRPAAVELTYLTQLESNPLMSRPQRQDIYKRLIERFSQFRDEDQAHAKAIQEGTYFRKGPGTSAAQPPPPQTVPAPTAPATVKPALGEFMVKARAANPGVSDGDLAKYWNEKYGNANR